MIYIPVNSYGHVGSVSSPNHTFFLGNRDFAVSQYFMHILSLVTDNKPSWISGRDENGGRNHFMMNLQESIGPGLDGIRETWICNQTSYRLCNAAGLNLVEQILLSRVQTDDWKIVEQ